MFWRTYPPLFALLSLQWPHFSFTKPTWSFPVFLTFLAMSEVHIYDIYIYYLFYCTCCPQSQFPSQSAFKQLLIRSEYCSLTSCLRCYVECELSAVAGSVFPIFFSPNQHKLTCTPFTTLHTAGCPLARTCLILTLRLCLVPNHLQTIISLFKLLCLFCGWPLWW